MPQRFSHRRKLIAAGIIVPAAIVLLVVALGSGGASRSASASRNAQRHRRVALPRLTATFSFARSGISGRTPADWRVGISRGVVRLTSLDGSAIMGIEALPGSSRRVLPLLASAVVTLTRDYRHAHVLRSPAGRLAGLPARSAVVVGLNRNRVPIRTLVAGARGRSHVYLLDVFTTSNTPVRRLVEAQQILLSLRLSG